MKYNKCITLMVLASCCLVSTAAAQNGPPSVSGQFQLTIDDGKGHRNEIRIPKSAPLQLDLTPWKELVEKADGVQIFADAAADAFEAFAGDFSRRLAAHVPPKSAWFGVAVQEAPEAVAAQFPKLKGSGLLVRDVAPGSPAAAAGLKANDVLVRLNSQLLFNEEQLQKLLRSMEVGAEVEAVWMRDGNESSAKCVLANAPAAGISEGLATALLGERAGEWMRLHGESELNRLAIQIASHPELLKHPELLMKLAEFKRLLTPVANGSLTMSDLQKIIDGARHNVPELKFLIGEIARTAQAEADLSALADKLKREVEAISPEARQRATALLKLLTERLANLANPK